VTAAALIVSLAIAFGCSKKDTSTQTASTGSAPAHELTDSELIQNTLTEVVTRWHYGDKGGMYDMEWEYLQDKYTFDEYLEFATIKPVSADTMESMIVTKTDIVPKESAFAYVDVVFRGPTGVRSIAKDTHLFFFHRGRWVRPIAGARYLQLDYEQILRSADSAAEAEAKLEGK
jgi:hypothetical protein